MHGQIVLDEISKRRATWRQMHDGCIGSGDIATVCGLNPFKSPLKLWAERTQKAEPEGESDLMWIGTELEPVVAKLYHRRTGEILDFPDTLYRHPQHSFALATPDVFSLGKGFDWLRPGEKLEPRKIVELKTGTEKAIRRWSSGTPIGVHCQTNWQSGVLGMVEATVFPFIANNPDYSEPEHFFFSPKAFEGQLESAHKFLECVQRDIPPCAGPGDSKLIHHLFYERDEASIKAFGDEEAKLLDEYQRLSKERAILNAKAKDLGFEIDKRKNELLLRMGDSKYARCGGRHLTAKVISNRGYTVDAFDYTQFYVKAE